MKEHPRVGDTFISVRKMGKEIFESEVELSYIITLGGEMKQGYSTTTYILEEEEGTLLTLIVEYTPSNLFYRILYKLTGWMDQIERLAECVEATHNKEKEI